MDERYERNMGAITGAEQKILLKARAAVAGCGGLGCYAAEFLARAGLGHITLIDGDVFAASNLNRQLYSLESNLGKSKVSEAKKRLRKIRADLSITVYDFPLDGKNAAELLKGHDVIIDALDSVKARLLAEKTADTLGTPLVHGAVRDWGAQVATVLPGDFTLSKLYPGNGKYGKPGALSFTPAFCASLQAAEAVKVLLKKENILRNKLLIADLREMSFDIITLE